MDPKTPKAQYLDWLEKKRERDRLARLESAMHTTALAVEVARDLGAAWEHLPEQIEPELAKAVMEIVAYDARENRDALERLTAAIEAQPDSQEKEIALRRLQLVGRGLPFDGFGGAAGSDKRDDPALYMQTIGRVDTRGVGGGAAKMCGCPRCNPRRRA